MWSTTMERETAEGCSNFLALLSPLLCFLSFFWSKNCRAYGCIIYLARDFFSCLFLVLDNKGQVRSRNKERRVTTATGLVTRFVQCSHPFLPSRLLSLLSFFISLPFPLPPSLLFSPALSLSLPTLGKFNPSPSFFLISLTSPQFCVFLYVSSDSRGFSLSLCLHAPQYLRLSSVARALLPLLFI